MTEEHVKGVLVQGALDGLDGAADKWERSEIEDRLTPTAVQLLDDVVNPMGWYDVADYRTILDAFWWLAGEGEPGFMLAAGAARSRLLLERAGYQVFVTAGRGDGDGDAEALLRNTRAALGLTRFLYDFVDVEAEISRDSQLRIDYRNVASFSDAMFLGTRGFVEGMTQLITGADVSEAVMPWESERFEDGRFRFSFPVSVLLEKRAERRAGEA